MHGEEAGSAHIIFDFYPEELYQPQELFKFRGKELVWMFQEA